MRKSFAAFTLLCALAATASAQSLPLYERPAPSPGPEAPFYPNPLAATEAGLFAVSGVNTPVPLWTESRVTDIVRAVDGGRERWFFLTGKGLYTSDDCRVFTPASSGLPTLTVKSYNGNAPELSEEAQSLKCAAVHPQDPRLMAAATKDAVFLSRDGGASWRNIGYSARVPGTKAVALATLPRNGAGELVVFLSHALYGVSYIMPDVPNARWEDLETGFAKVPSMGYADEVSSILPVITYNEAGNAVTEVYFAQTFVPAVYRLDWEHKAAAQVFSGASRPDTIDGLAWTGNNLLFTRPGSIALCNPASGKITGEPSELPGWKRMLQKVPGEVYAAYIPRSRSGFADGLVLRELWLLKPPKVYAPYGDAALGKRSVYMPANRGAEAAGIASYLNLLEKNRLNSVVIDMKDDYGLLRYRSKDPLVMEKCRVSQYAITIEDFTARFKERGVYLIARIVVFKDKNLAQYRNSEYAVWNRQTGSRWRGIKSTKKVTGEDGVTRSETEYYDEDWVDPYSEEVWEYNIRIAQELIREGFDEIQFDYIRFPTDGINLYQTEYRWKGRGMDMESALISFLKYARDNIQAPIGIDIYGANGWYRSGARTGQDVELLADYVDVICPMFYPSHFEQQFLAHAPAELRPYRIYYYGSYRNTVIARNKVIVRPWVQAFYLGVSYDRAYYNPRYIVLELYGVRDAVDRGFMYWNNSGRYEDITPGAPEAAEYPLASRGEETPFRAEAR